MARLNAEQLNEIYERLESGEFLDPSLQPLLFEAEKREHELVYEGKKRREDVLADTLAVPLQLARTFAPDERPETVFDNENWHNRLIFGDNLQAMRSLLDLKKNGTLCNADGTPGVRLIYIDPPFATRQEFRGNQDQKAYADKVLGARFIEILRQRLILMHELLSDDGAIYLHLDTKKVHYMKIVLDEIFGENNFINQIVWKRINAKGNVQRKWGAVHECALFYAKDAESFIWNQPLRGLDQKYVDEMYRYTEEETGRRYRTGDLSAPASRASKGQIYKWKGYELGSSRCWVYAKEKMQGLEDAGRIVYTKNGYPQFKRYLDESEGEKVPDVWDDINPAAGNEGIGYPTQKPEALLERIIRASSNEGDLVLDAFMGSGTTCAVAEKLKRRWIGIDAGKLAIYTTQKRILNLKTQIGNKGKELPAQPFALYNAGLYDFASLQKLDREHWRFFALQLFECRDDVHPLGGLVCDGRKNGFSVLVFNQHAQPTVVIDEDYIANLHARIGKAAGARFYVIAPRAVFDFQEDYLELDDTRYYALRIPYSFIEELHKTKFSALRQASAEGLLNDFQEVVGFDFIEPPDVKFRACCRQPLDVLVPSAVLETTHFHSQARSRNGATVTGFAALSMLLVDLDYNGKTFDYDRAFYGHELEAAAYCAQWPLHETGARVGAIWLDIHGNESFQVIEREQFETLCKDNE